MLQRIKLEDGITLFDSPGMLWPNIENEHSGYRLAITGGIKETAFELPDIASYAAEYLLTHYPQRLKERYQLDEIPLHDPFPDVAFLETVGRDRGCLVSGGQVDLDKISRILITEIRDGQLGALTFETPEMMEQELQQVDIKREQKRLKTSPPRCPQTKEKQTQPLTLPASEYEDEKVHAQLSPLLSCG